MSQLTSSEKGQYLKLAEKIGDFIEYWGFKQVHGKIWTLIFLANEPVDANYLKDTLKISKALTSMSLKDLLYYDVIHEVSKDKPGTQKYKINPDITEVILNVINQRELKLLNEINDVCQQFEKNLSKKNQTFINKHRMSDLSNMIQAAHFLVAGMTAGDKVDFKLFDDVMQIED